MNEKNDDDLGITANFGHEELPKEFSQVCQTPICPSQLTLLIYNQLTLDKISHSETLNKIRDGHKDNQGFPKRNIRRYLPSDNQATPERVSPPRGFTIPWTKVYESGWTENVSKLQFVDIVTCFRKNHLATRKLKCI